MVLVVYIMQYLYQEILENFQLKVNTIVTDASVVVINNNISCVYAHNWDKILHGGYDSLIGELSGDIQGESEF